MKKGAVISLVRNVLSGGGQDQNRTYLHESVISAFMDAVWSEMVSEVDDYGPFLSSYPGLEIQLDEDRDEHFIELPDGLVNTGFEVFSVGSDQDRKNTWPLISAGELSIYCNMDVSTCLPFAYHESDRLYISNMNRFARTALLRVLRGIADLEDTDDVKIPGGKEMTFVNLVIERMMQQLEIPEDVINDNNES